MNDKIQQLAIWEAFDQCAYSVFAFFFGKKIKALIVPTPANTAKQGWTLDGTTQCSI